MDSPRHEQKLGGQHSLHPADQPSYIPIISLRAATNQPLPLSIHPSIPIKKPLPTATTPKPKEETPQKAT
jgi:hypothetical protein